MVEKRQQFKVDGTKLLRLGKHCPRCGPGVYLGKHEGRVACGRCGYTEFASA